MQRLEKFRKAGIRVLIVLACLVFTGGAGSGIYFHAKYTGLRDTVESANAGELQRRYELVTGELERAKSAIARSGQSVAGLEELDQRRLEWIGRIYGIADDAAKSASGIESGEQRARIAFEAIGRIVDELEAESGGSPK